MEKVFCDVRDCPIELGPKSGLELTVTVRVGDRKDGDADAVTIRLHPCNRNHAESLLNLEKDPKVKALLDAVLTDEGKRKRGPATIR